MRKIYTLAIITMALLCSCEREHEIGVRDNDTKGDTITAVLEQPSDTKTEVQEDYSVFWEPSEEIMVFCGSKSAKFTSLNTENSASATFQSSQSIISGSNQDIWALYPYDEDATFADGIITTTIPWNQVAVPGTFARNTNVTVAHSTTTNLQFYNVCGGVRFSVSESDIRSILFRGANDETIAGKVNISVDGNGIPSVKVIDGSKGIVVSAPEGKTFEVGKWYYIATLPISLPHGFTMQMICDTRAGLFTSTKSNTIKRSTFGSLSNVDVNVDYISNEIIDTNAETVYDYLKDFLDDDNAETLIARNVSEITSLPNVKDVTISESYTHVEFVNGTGVDYIYSIPSIFDDFDVEGESEAPSQVASIRKEAKNSPYEKYRNATVVIFNWFSNESSYKRKQQNMLVEKTAKVFRDAWADVCLCGFEEFTEENLRSALANSEYVFINTVGIDDGTILLGGHKYTNTARSDFVYVNENNETNDDTWSLITPKEYEGYFYRYASSINVCNCFKGKLLYFASCYSLKYTKRINNEKKPRIIGWDGINKIGQAFGLILADYYGEFGETAMGIMEDFTGSMNGTIVDPLTNSSLVCLYPGDGPNLGWREIRQDYSDYWIDSPYSGDCINNPKLSLRIPTSQTFHLGYHQGTKTTGSEKYYLICSDFETEKKSDVLRLKPGKDKKYSFSHLKPGVYRVSLVSDFISGYDETVDCAYIILSNKFDANDVDESDYLPEVEVETLEPRVEGKTVILSGAVTNMDGSSFEKGFYYWDTDNPTDVTVVNSSDYSNLFVATISLPVSGNYSYIAYAIDEDQHAGLGEEKTFTVDTETTAVDLSAFGTANCYIVSKAGTYKFKTVQGNTSISVGSVASAEVLWGWSIDETSHIYIDSYKEVIEDPAYSDGQITFRATGEKGNAVIIAKDASGKILWSWHIWFTDKPEDQVYKNNAGTMMDRNLGATSTVPGSAGSLGLLYQWGRKDPFTNRQDIHITDGAWLNLWKIEYNNLTIEESISNPTHLLVSSNGDWLAQGNDFLWSSVKTKYDPCPSGYRVPDGGDYGVWATACGNTLLYLSNSETQFDNTNGGLLFDVIESGEKCWYPASGCVPSLQLGDNYASVSKGDILGYWTCSPFENNTAMVMFWSNPYLILTADLERSYGFSVRCLKEE